MKNFIGKLQEFLVLFSVVGITLLALKGCAHAGDGNLSVNEIMNNTTNSYIYNYAPNNRGRVRNNPVTVAPSAPSVVSPYSNPYISPPIPSVGTGDIFGNWIGQRYNVYTYSPNSLDLE